MKKITLLFLLSLCLGSFVVAQEIDQMPLITVSGTADVMIPPDEVVFSLDVTKTDKELAVAKRLNDETVGRILELARRFDVLPQNVKTDNISVDMIYQSVRDPKKKIYDEDGDEVGTKIFKGYEISKTVTVRLTDITRFEEFFAEVLKTGVTKVENVSFETSKLRENKDKARDMAMKAAREKAQSMAASVGQTIGKAVRINEGTVSGRTGNLSSNSNTFVIDGEGLGSESVATFAPGAIKVEAQVTVSFLLN